MGASISTTTNTNEMVNEQMTKAMTNSFASCDMNSNQNQDSIVIGNKDTNVDVSQNMLLKVLATCEITNEITNAIKNNIDTFLKDKKDITTSAPLIGLTYTSTDFLNTIRNKINTEITSNAVSKIMQSVKASQNTLIANNNGGNVKVTQEMTGDILLKALIKNKVINNALNELKNQLEIDYKSKNTGFDWNTILNILITICVIILCWYGVPFLFKLFSNKKKNNYNNRNRNRYRY
jgi:hypothetical protein